MSSTPSISSMRRSRSSGRHGANPTPQLPITTVVTPCHADGTMPVVPRRLAVVVGVDVDEARHHHGAVGVDHPAASLALERRRPRRCDRRRCATSAVRGGRPVPSTTVPPRIRMSSAAMTASLRSPSPPGNPACDGQPATGLRLPLARMVQSASVGGIAAPGGSEPVRPVDGQCPADHRRVRTARPHQPVPTHRPRAPVVARPPGVHGCDLLLPVRDDRRHDARIRRRAERRQPASRSTCGCRRESSAGRSSGPPSHS